MNWKRIRYQAINRLLTNFAVASGLAGLYFTYLTLAKWGFVG